MILLSEYWFLEMGPLCYCHRYHIYLTSFGFYYWWDQWVLDFWRWSLLLLSLVSYFQSFVLYYCRDQWVLKSGHSYINIHSVCVFENYTFYSVVSFCFAGIVINARPIIYFFSLMKMKSKPLSVTYNLLSIWTMICATVVESVVAILSYFNFQFVTN